VFTRAAFAAAVGNPSRVKVTDQQHNRAVNIGMAVELRDEPDGLYGKLKIADTTAGRDVLTLLRERVLEELSVEFRPMARRFQVVRRAADDLLVRHDKAELVGVSPVGAGAYGDQARVLLVRNAERERAREKAMAYLDSLVAGPVR
jgi:HK97 family phage prohead protease